MRTQGSRIQALKQTESASSGINISYGDKTFASNGVQTILHVMPPYVKGRPIPLTDVGRKRNVSCDLESLKPPVEQRRMFCPRCGQTIAEGTTFCVSCGSPASVVAGSSSQPPQPAAATGGVLVPGPTSGKAITSLVLGLLSFSFVAAIPAVVFGHLALSEIKKSAGRIQGKGMAIAGLVLGYLGIVMLPFILIIAAIAIPNLLRARIAANEASAVSSIRILNSAEVSYATSHVTGYTCSLTDLQTAGLLDSPLASGTRNGYVFVLQNCAANTPGGAISRYQVIAYPSKPQQSGSRSFCSTESGAIRVDVRGPESCLEDGSDL
jgi:competence protein ComGC